MEIIYKVFKKYYCHTLVCEYWDDMLIYTYDVCSRYNGGDLKEFINNHNYYRHIHWDNLNEFHRRTMILDL